MDDTDADGVNEPNDETLDVADSNELLVEKSEPLTVPVARCEAEGASDALPHAVAKDAD